MDCILTCSVQLYGCTWFNNRVKLKNVLLSRVSVFQIVGYPTQQKPIDMRTITIKFYQGLFCRRWICHVRKVTSTVPRCKCMFHCPVVLVFRARTIPRTRHPSTRLHTQRISEERSSPRRTSRVHCSQALRDSRPSHNRCRPNQDGTRIARWRCCTYLREIGSCQKRRLCHD